MWRPLWERDQAELGGGKDNETKSFRELYRIRLVFFSLHAFLVERFFVRTVEVLCVRLGCITCRENFILLFLFRLFHLMRAQDNLRELSEYRGRWRLSCLEPCARDGFGGNLAWNFVEWCKECVVKKSYSGTHVEKIRCLLRFEKVRAAKMAAHRRRVLRVESQVAVLQKEAHQYQSAIEVERKKLVASVAELKNFELAR
jgi:hypothetical protein